jgi:Fur family ferric uptake transcriptional regulator
MNASAIKSTLKAYSLRQTECREEILDIFLTKAYALAHADVEIQMSEKFDRVTVYRTLKTFLDKGLIHKVLDDEGYQICPLQRQLSCRRPQASSRSCAF